MVKINEVSILHEQKGAGVRVHSEQTAVGCEFTMERDVSSLYKGKGVRFHHDNKEQ